MKKSIKYGIVLVVIIAIIGVYYFGYFDEYIPDDYASGVTIEKIENFIDGFSSDDDTTGDDDDDDNGCEGIRFTAQELFDTYTYDAGAGSFNDDFLTLSDGDAFCIEGAIDYIEYNQEHDATYFFFDYVLGEYTYPRAITVSGDITDEYSAGDNVLVSLHIKHVDTRVVNYEYDIEMFAENWVDEQYFRENCMGLLYAISPMSQDFIKKL